LPRLLLVIKDSGKYVNPECDEKTPYSHNLVSYMQEKEIKSDAGRAAWHGCVVITVTISVYCNDG